MKLIWPWILCLQMIHLYGQEFKISNSNKTNIIKKTYPVEIRISKVPPLSKNCCVVQVVEGHIIQIKKDSVYILFDQLRIRNDNKQITDVSKFYLSDNDTLVIDQKDIYSL